MMKKKVSALLLSAALTAGLLTGCSSGNTAYAKYVKLGEYKGLSVNKIKTEVTDDDVEAEIESILDENSEYTDVDRAAKDGDQVNIDFTGTIDGEEFDGSSDTDYDLVIGSEDFQPEFEENIIGAKTGDTLNFSITISEDYDEELAGKKADFEVKVNSVQEIDIPELTDDFCKEYTDYDTVDAFRAGVKAELESYYDEDNSYMAGSDALSQVIENSEISGYPQELYDKCKEEYDANNEAMAEMFGMEVEDIAGSEEDIKAAVEEMVYTEMIVSEIAEKEKITVSDDEYKEYVDSVYEDSGYDSAEEYEADYTKEETISSILYDKVTGFLLDNANITEISEDEYYSSYYDEEDLELDSEDESDSESFDSEDESASEDMGLQDDADLLDTEANK